MNRVHWLFGILFLVAQSSQQFIDRQSHEFEGRYPTQDVNLRYTGNYAPPTKRGNNRIMIGNDEDMQSNVAGYLDQLRFNDTSNPSSKITYKNRHKKKHRSHNYQKEKKVQYMKSDFKSHNKQTSQQDDFRTFENTDFDITQLCENPRNVFLSIWSLVARLLQIDEIYMDESQRLNMFTDIIKRLEEVHENEYGYINYASNYREQHKYVVSLLHLIKSETVNTFEITRHLERIRHNHISLHPMLISILKNTIMNRVYDLDSFGNLEWIKILRLVKTMEMSVIRSNTFDSHTSNIWENSAYNKQEFYEKEESSQLHYNRHEEDLLHILRAKTINTKEITRHLKIIINNKIRIHSTTISELERLLQNQFYSSDSYSSVEWSEIRQLFEQVRSSSSFESNDQAVYETETSKFAFNKQAIFLLNLLRSKTVSTNEVAEHLHTIIRNKVWIHPNLISEIKRILQYRYESADSYTNWEWSKILRLFEEIEISSATAYKEMENRQVIEREAYNKFDYNKHDSFEWDEHRNEDFNKQSNLIYEKQESAIDITRVLVQMLKIKLYNKFNIFREDSQNGNIYDIKTTETKLRELAERNSELIKFNNLDLHEGTYGTQSEHAAFLDQLLNNQGAEHDILFTKLKSNVKLQLSLVSLLQRVKYSLHEKRTLTTINSPVYDWQSRYVDNDYRNQRDRVLILSLLLEEIDKVLETYEINNFKLQPVLLLFLTRTLNDIHIDLDEHSDDSEWIKLLHNFKECDFNSVNIDEFVNHDSTILDEHKKFDFSKEVENESRNFYEQSQGNNVFPGFIYDRDETNEGNQPNTANFVNNIYASSDYKNANLNKGYDHEWNVKKSHAGDNLSSLDEYGHVKQNLNMSEEAKNFKYLQNQQESFGRNHDDAFKQSYNLNYNNSQENKLDKSLQQELAIKNEYLRPSNFEGSEAVASNVYLNQNHLKEASNLSTSSQESQQYLDYDRHDSQHNDINNLGPDRYLTNGNNQQMTIKKGNYESQSSQSHAKEFELNENTLNIENHSRPVYNYTPSIQPIIEPIPVQNHSMNVISEHTLQSLVVNGKMEYERQVELVSPLLDLLEAENLDKKTINNNFRVFLKYKVKFDVALVLMLERKINKIIQYRIDDQQDADWKELIHNFDELKKLSLA